MYNLLHEDMEQGLKHKRMHSDSLLLRRKGTGEPKVEGGDPFLRKKIAYFSYLRKKYI